VRVTDAQNLIYDGLCALDWRHYLCAAWIVCGELQELYAERLTADESAVITSTLDVLRACAIEGGPNTDTVRIASGLYERWQLLITERKREVRSGHWNTWVVFRELAAEVAGLSEHYSAAERVELAATKRWREEQRGPRYLDPDEEIDDDSPMARTLASLIRIVSGVAALSDSAISEAGWDPLAVQMLLSG
jgi:hypothetical protein